MLVRSRELTLCACRSSQRRASSSKSRASHTSTDQLLDKRLTRAVYAAIETLSKVTGNILSPPDGAAALKFRQLRLSNPQIQRNVVDVAGAYDYILLCGFRKSTGALSVEISSLLTEL